MSELDVAAYLTSKGLRGKAVAGGRELTYPCFLGCAEPADSTKRKLYVEAATGFYHCKVCDASGGAWLLQKHFGDEPRNGTSDDVFMRRRILDAAVDVGEQMLMQNDDVALYLTTERGLTPETIVDRRLGFIAGGWSLTGSLPEDATREQLLTTGLVHRDGAKAGKDFFWRHLLIPYLTRGHCIQIRGRIWGEASGGKYMTGPGEPVRAYNTDSLDGADEVILTEGEFDTMIVAQALAASPEQRARRLAVISLPGTNAVPEELMDLLSDVRRIYLGFDSDDAGVKAAIAMKEKIGTRARILQLPYDGGRKCDWTEYLLPASGVNDWVNRHPYAGHTAADVLHLLTNAAGKRIFSVAEAGLAFRSYRSQHEGMKTGFRQLDATIKPGLLPGQLVIILAKTGCLAGDTEIAVNRAGKGFKIPIAKLLDRWEGVKYAWDRSIPTYVQRAHEGDVRLVRLVNAWRSGVKTTYTLVTETGRTIRATDEHPFFTDTGFRPLGELAPGDHVAVNAGRSVKGRTESKGDYSKRTVPAHPFAGRRNVRTGGHSVPLHRLVFEAHLNGLETAVFVAHLREPAAEVTHLRFLDPAVYTVHHIDHDHRNNAIDNLALLTHSAHHTLHAYEGKTRHVLEQVGYERIVSIEKFGDEETYDIEVEDDPHNFMANGFAVHNTGKTLFLCNLAYNMRAQRILFVSLEMTREEVYDRLRRIYLFHHPRATDHEVEHGLRNVFICDENRLAERELSDLIAEFAIEADEAPDVVFVDYLGYFARGAKGNSPYEKVSNAVMSLKALAKQHRLVMFAPSQVNRGAVPGKPIDLDDARDAGQVEETADFLLALFRPDDALDPEGEQPKSGKLKCSILKSRHGGKDTVFALVSDVLTLAIVDDLTPAARRADEHNSQAGRGIDWNDLREIETAPIQMEARYDR